MRVSEEEIFTLATKLDKQYLDDSKEAIDTHRELYLACEFFYQSLGEGHQEVFTNLIKKSLELNLTELTLALLATPVQIDDAIAAELAKFVEIRYLEDNETNEVKLFLAASANFPKKVSNFYADIGFIEFLRNSDHYDLNKDTSKTGFVIILLLVLQRKCQGVIPKALCGTYFKLGFAEDDGRLILPQQEDKKVLEIFRQFAASLVEVWKQQSMSLLEKVLREKLKSCVDEFSSVLGQLVCTAIPDQVVLLEETLKRLHLKFDIFERDEFLYYCLPINESTQLLMDYLLQCLDRNFGDGGLIRFTKGITYNMGQYFITAKIMFFEAQCELVEKFPNLLGNLAEIKDDGVWKYSTLMLNLEQAWKLAEKFNLIDLFEAELVGDPLFQDNLPQEVEMQPLRKGDGTLLEGLMADVEKIRVSSNPFYVQRDVRNIVADEINVDAEIAKKMRELLHELIKNCNSDIFDVQAFQTSLLVTVAGVKNTDSVKKSLAELGITNAALSNPLLETTLRYPGMGLAKLLQQLIYSPLKDYFLKFTEEVEVVGDCLELKFNYSNLDSMTQLTDEHRELENQHREEGEGIFILTIYPINILSMQEILKKPRVAFTGSIENSNNY